MLYRHCIPGITAYHGGTLTYSSVLGCIHCNCTAMGTIAMWHY